MTRKLLLCFALSLILTGSKAADVVFYDGTVNNGSWPSWGSATTPCTLNVNGSSAITTSTDFYLAGKSASLNLGWLSGPNGTTWPWWSIDVASNSSWSAQDISSTTMLRIWLYSTATIAATDLPQLYIKNSNGAYSSNVKLGAYATSGVPAATWTKVEIPIADFAYSSTVVDRVSFLKDLDDNVAHTLFIGEIAFTSDITTGIGEVKKNNNVPYFSDGVLRIQGISGEVNIHDVTGKLLAAQKAMNESVSISLEKGSYILNCSKGSFKFLVK